MVIEVRHGFVSLGEVWLCALRHGVERQGMVWGFRLGKLS